MIYKFVAKKAHVSFAQSKLVKIVSIFPPQFWNYLRKLNIKDSILSEIPKLLSLHSQVKQVTCYKCKHHFENTAFGYKLYFIIISFSCI